MSHPRWSALFWAFVSLLPPAGGIGQITASDTPVAAGPRQTILFDHSWRFHYGEAIGAEQVNFDDSTWKAVDLPHDWSIEGAPNPDPQKQGGQDGPFDKNSAAGSGGGYLNGGIGWYRKTFSLPATGQGEHVTILFDGAYENADVYLNGQKLGSHPYGFTSFFYDVTSVLNHGVIPNVLSARLQADQPGCRWYSGAGIYRHVWLITSQPIHIAQWGTFVTTPKAGADGAEVLVKTQVAADHGAASTKAVLTTVVLDPSGKEVAREETAQEVSMGSTCTFEQSLPLASARLWSLETPALYRAVSELRVNNKVVDSLTTPFGIRSFVFTKDRGFFLNGRHIQIQGVCDHHDLGCLGSAAYRRAIERQLEILKSFGCNAIRTSHNPPSPELLELCDQMGFLVMDESFDEWKESHHRYGYGSSFDQWSEPDMVSMLDRDRNHPSIILWSIGNEIPEGREGKPVAGEIAKRLVAICHREIHPSRHVGLSIPRHGLVLRFGKSPGRLWNQLQHILVLEEWPCQRAPRAGGIRGPASAGGKRNQFMYRHPRRIRPSPGLLRQGSNRAEAGFPAALLLRLLPYELGLYRGN